VENFDPIRDYPLGGRRPDLVRTHSGLALDALTLEALRAGRLDPADMRATPETLLRQADVARAAGRAQLAENLAGAAELTTVPDDVILELYTALRPRRATTPELERWADRLEQEYAARRVAAFVREAADAYAERGLLAPEPTVEVERQ
jgi:propanediol dehydratase small subunit